MATAQTHDEGLLEAIHVAGFIHRDIKPEKIYLRDDGSAVLLDFGSARQAVGGETLYVPIVWSQLLC